MTRLPQPGGDNGNWGDILNDFLTTSHNNDGTLKAQADITDAKTKADSAVQSINTKTPTNGALTLAATDVNAEPAGLSDDTKAQLNDTFVLPVGLPRASEVPAGLGWDQTIAPVIPSIIESFDSRVIGSAGITPQALFDRFSTARSAPTATYYVSTTGSDSANGLTSATAFRSLHKAQDAAFTGGVPTLVLVAPGSYERAYSFNTGTNPASNADIAWVNSSPRTGQVVTGTWDAVTGFGVDATYANTYSKTVANCTRVLDLTQYDRFGNWVELVNVVTVAQCNITPGSWTLAGGTLYINRLDGSAPSDANTRYFRDSPSFQVHDVNVYMDGFDLQGSGSNYAVFHINSAATTPPMNQRAVVTNNCQFRWGGSASITSNGAGLRAVNWYGLIANFGARSDANADDAFGIHNPADNGTAMMLNVNCSGKNNGRGLHQSVNGFTGHEHCQLIDIAGDYDSNHGGNVHTINSCRTYLFGTRSSNDLSDSYAGGSIPAVAVRAADSATTWCERVRTTMPQGKFDYQAVTTTSTIYRKDCAPALNPDAGTGTFSAF